MDLTGFLVLVIGLAGTVVGAVFPSKYPAASKLAINVAWWGGWGVAVVSAIILFVRWVGLGLIVAAASRALSVLGTNIQAPPIPAYWLIAIGVVAIGLYRWRALLAELLTRPFASAASGISEWLTPYDALFRYCDNALLAKHSKSNQRNESLRRRIDEIRNQIESRANNNSEKNDLVKDLADIQEQSTDSALAFVVYGDNLIKDLRYKLRQGQLVGKAKETIWPLKRQRERILPPVFWNAIDFSGAGAELKPVFFFKNIVYSEIRIGKPGISGQ